MTGTSYFDVYRKAITEFKDPTLKNLLENDTVMFSQVMYNFLENAISLFTNPIPAQKRVNDRVAPKLYVNEFVSDGATTSFVLDNIPDNSVLDDCLFEYKVNNEIVEGEYDSETRTVNLFRQPLENSDIELNIYYVGNWNVELYPMEEYILSQFIMSTWSEYIQNDKLDVIRLLGDTDFKLSSVATTTNAKSNWNIVNKETVIKRMTKYAWDSAIQGLYK